MLKVHDCVDKSVQHFHEGNIVNFDEYNCPIVMASEQIVGKCGAEVVHASTHGDAKGNFSFFGSICSDGTKLPLVSIAREEWWVTISTLAIKYRVLFGLALTERLVNGRLNVSCSRLVAPTIAK
jgi:hypothetical protein